jgi:hypothetical protein
VKGSVLTANDYVKDRLATDSWALCPLQGC